MSEPLRAFIPAEMDEYGLTAPQFRVYCRIQRRGECTESIKNIARGCRLDSKTVKKAIKDLEEINVVRKDKRPGQSSVITANPPAQWVRPRVPNALAQSAPQGAKRSTSQGNRHPNHLAQSATHEGNPIEGNPRSGTQPEVGRDTPPPCEAQSVIDEWNAMATKCGLPSVKSVSPKRLRIISTRLRDNWWVPNWREAMEAIPQKGFLLGHNDRGWKANFDFFLKPDTAAKIMEGQYDDNTSRNRGHGRDRNAGTFNAGRANEYANCGKVT